MPRTTAGYYKEHDLKPPKSLQKLAEEERELGVREWAECCKCESRMRRQAQVPADLMFRILFHAAAILTWLVMEPTKAISALYTRSILRMIAAEKPSRSMQLTTEEYPLLEIYVIQERAKLEAPEADEAPVAQAQPPPEIAMVGRHVA